MMLSVILFSLVQCEVGSSIGFKHSRPSLRYPPFGGALSLILLSPARLAQANKFGERGIRPARSTRKRGRERRHGGAAVPIERPQVDVTGSAAGRGERSQEPIAGRDGGADRWREQHRHPLGLALVPNGHQLLGILKDLPLGRAARSGFLLGLLPAGILHFALVESHAGVLRSLRQRRSAGRPQVGAGGPTSKRQTA